MKLELSMAEFKTLLKKHDIHLDSVVNGLPQNGSDKIYLNPPFPKDFSPVTRKEAIISQYPSMAGFFNSKDKVQTIKEYRSLTGCSLLEAKTIIDEAMDVKEN